MANHELDSFAAENIARRASQELEVIIQESNSENISQFVGEVSSDDVADVARAVSLLRATYLNEVLKLGKLVADEQNGAGDLTIAVKRMIRYRKVYEEGLEGFGALRHAMVKGYFRLESDELDEAPVGGEEESGDTSA